MTTGRTLSLAAAVAGLSLCCAVGLQGQSGARLPDKESFLRETRSRLQSDRGLLREYIHSEREREVKVSRLGKVTTGPEKLYQVYPSEAGAPAYRRLLAVNGKPLSQAELDKQDRQRLEDLKDLHARREKESPADRAKRLARIAEQEQREHEAVEEFTHLFDFDLVGRETVDGDPAIIVTFAPRPGYKPRTRLGRLLKNFRGRALVTETGYQLARIDAEAIDDVSFGWVIGRLYKGSQASFRRRKFANDVWLPAEARFTGLGRALFRKFEVETHTEYFDYRKFSTSTDTTLQLPTPDRE